MPARAASDRDFVLEEAKAREPELYLSCLYAPEEARPLIAALILFGAETARIPLTVSEPMAGLVRLQWWQDALHAAASGRPEAQPVLRLLAPELMAGRLPLGELDHYLEARAREIEGPLPDTMGRLERHMEGTTGRLLRLWLKLLAPSAPPAWVTTVQDAGLATGLLDLARHVGRRQLPALSMVPEEVLRRARTERVRLVDGPLDELGRVREGIAERAHELCTLIEPPRFKRSAIAAYLPAFTTRALAREMGAPDSPEGPMEEPRLPFWMPARLHWAWLRAGRG